MKIVFFSDSYKPYQSGVTISLFLFKKYLEKLGHDVFVFAPCYPHFIEEEKNVFRTLSIATPYVGFRLALPGYFRIFNKTREIQPDIIHLYSPFQMGLTGRYIAGKLKIPIVYTFHTLFTEYLHFFPVIPVFLARTLIIKYLNWFIKNCERIIVPTLTAGNEFVGYGNTEKKLEIIPTGVDFESFCAKTGNIDLNIDLTGKKVLICAGRLSKEKNLPFLIKTFKLVLEKSKNAVLIFAGQGPWKKKLERIVKELKISDKVIFTGELRHREVFYLLEKAHLFICASKTETQGLAVLEAAVMGVPIIAVRAGGIKDVVVDGENGFLVEENESVFAQKIINLLNNEKERLELSEKARNKALTFFSMEILAKKLEKVYLSTKH
jgi:glycosyltransferase involved in cell wall biosynthesis